MRQISYRRKDMEIRLIAADMDGTLLDDEKRIPEENLRAFRACAARGIEIVPATGRTMRGLPDELRNLPGVHYAILTNGAQVVDLAKTRSLTPTGSRWPWRKRS